MAWSGRASTVTQSELCLILEWVWKASALELYLSSYSLLPTVFLSTCSFVVVCSR